MSFASPLALLGLLVDPGRSWCSTSLGERRRTAQARALRRPGARPEPRLAVAAAGVRRLLPFALALVALARARRRRRAAARRTARVTAHEATIVLAIDTSRSMAATDVQPSRLRRRRIAAARAFLDEVPENYSVGHRLVLDRGRRRCCRRRPTAMRRGRRSTELRLGSGTAIGDAIDALRRARARPSGAGERPRPRTDARSPAAVLLLSDGAQTAGDIAAASPRRQQARRLGVPVTPSRSARATRSSRCRCPAASRSGSSSRPTRRRCASIARIDRRLVRGGADAERLESGLPRARHAARARRASASRSPPRSPAAAPCCCSSAARSRRSGSGGPL